MKNITSQYNLSLPSFVLYTLPEVPEFGAGSKKPRLREWNLTERVERAMGM